MVFFLSSFLPLFFFLPSEQLKQFTSHSSEADETHDQGTDRLNVWREPLPSSKAIAFLLRPQMVEGARELSEFYFLRVLISFLRVLSSWPLEDPPLNTIILEIWISIFKFWKKTNIQSIISSESHTKQM